MRRTSKTSDCGIYIHVPFCVRKCSYCDFYSVPVKDEMVPADYITAVSREIEREAKRWQDKTFVSIYFGGGTPSLLSGTQIRDWFKTLTGRVNLAAGAEISLEANPATLTRDKIKAYQDLGINRISLGVQSFADPDLAVLGRIHRQYQVYGAISDLTAQGFKNFNIDLIYGVPGQTMAGWLMNLAQTVDCRPAHISLYLLQLEPNTDLGRKVGLGQVKLLDESLESDLYYESIEFLTRNGFRHYEISNWALPGKESRHNLFYWTGSDYWGLGAGAVSFRENIRYMNQEDHIAYCREDYPVRDIMETMSDADLVSDAVILGLRLCSGIDLSAFKQRFGVDILTAYSAAMVKHIEQGLLEIQDNCVRLTKKGYFLSNQVFYDFIT